MLKLEIRNIIVIYLVDEEILNEDVLDLVKTFWVDAVKMREIEMKEKIRLNEIQLQKEEMQMQSKIKEIEFEQFRLSKEKEEIVSLALPSVHNTFDVTKYLRFVPPVLEKEVDK